MTVTEFRTCFPEFSDEAIYPDDSVQFWLDMADRFLVATRWGDALPLGLALFTAHNMALDRQTYLSGQRGAAPGISGGVMASKSLGGASVSYESVQALFADAGAWALTQYGRRFWTLIRLMGMGGMQI